MTLNIDIVEARGNSVFAHAENTSNLSTNKTSLKIVVSIAPFQSLVAGVMQGVAEPKLLMPPGASPHHYSLKPSEVQMLHKADLIFWGGPELESFLTNVLKNLPPSNVVELSKAKGLHLLPVRKSPTWPEHHHSENDHDEHEHHDHHNHDHHHDDHHHDHQGLIDMHFWLDPMNAILLVDDIADKLSKKDPDHQSIYLKNSEVLKKQLKNLNSQLKNKLKDIKNIPFLVFHDGYQYFEKRYGLKAVGAIALHPELPLSLERLNTVRQEIIDSHARCVFSEPQFKPKLVETLVQETGVKTGVLDPEGANIPHNGEGYFILLNDLADSLHKCLADPSKP